MHRHKLFSSYLHLKCLLMRIYINFSLPELDDLHLFNNNGISCQDGLLQHDRKRYDSQPAEAITLTSHDMYHSTLIIIVQISLV